MTKGDIKLMAKDAEDLSVMSAVLQDALAPLSEMRHLPEDRRFVMVLNRFRWERSDRVKKSAPDAGDASFADADDYGDVDLRVHTGLCVDLVKAVRTRGIDRSKPDQFLSLLTLSADGDNLNFFCAGGAVIQLEVDKLSVFLQDLDEAWPTQWRPDHKIGPNGATPNVASPREPGKK
jgi:hypothetical protein